MDDADRTKPRREVVRRVGRVLRSGVHNLTVVGVAQKHPKARVVQPLVAIGWWICFFAFFFSNAQSMDTFLKVFTLRCAYTAARLWRRRDKPGGDVYMKRTCDDGFFFKLRVVVDDGRDSPARRRTTP